MSRDPSPARYIRVTHTVRFIDGSKTGPPFVRHKTPLEPVFRTTDEPEIPQGPGSLLQISVNFPRRETRGDKTSQTRSLDEYTSKRADAACTLILYMGIRALTAILRF